MKLDVILNMFDSFVMEYIAYNKSIQWSFFHHHGINGRAVAAEALYEWSQIKKRLLSNEGYVYSIGELLRELKHLMKKDFLTGHFNAHSLKTYLLAYHDFVFSVRNESADNLPTHDVAFAAHFKNKWEIANPEQIKARYEQVSGIEADKMRQALMDAAIYGDSQFYHSFRFLII